VQDDRDFIPGKRTGIFAMSAIATNQKSYLHSLRVQSLKVTIYLSTVLGVAVRVITNVKTQLYKSYKAVLNRVQGKF
jgi:hypothetical protein